MSLLLSASPLGSGILNWNHAGYEVIARQGPHGGAWTPAAAALAEWGIFALAFTLVALLFFGRPVGGARAAAVAGAAAAVVALLVNHVVGLIWYEPRPYLSSFHVPLLAAAAHGNSFPSDHLAFAGAVVGSLWVMGRRGLAAAGFLVAAGVAWARVLTGIHWPFDVIVGLAIGLAVGVLVGGIVAAIPAIGRWLASVKLSRLPALVGSVVVVAIGFVVLEKATHIGIVAGPVGIGVVLMVVLGMVAPRPQAAVGSGRS